MFKLIKINNSRCNCPEFIKMDCIDADLPLVSGAMVSRLDHSLSTATEKSAFVLTRSYDSNKDVEAVLYPVTADMIFRTFILGETDVVATGMSISMASSDNSDVIDCVKANPDGNGRVINVIGQVGDRFYVEVCFDGR